MGRSSCASSADLAFLAMGTGKVPEQSAVILILDHPVISACLNSGG
jgi:hypothetical protein